MAGTPVGTIFAELDLDTTRYTKAQQQLLRDATTTSLRVEDEFKKLNIRSSAEYDLMRAKIINANEAIKHSAIATANDIARAERAKNEQLARLDEQQFGKQTSMLASLKTHWLGATAAIAASLGAMYKAWDMAKAGAEFEEQRGLLDNLTRKYETSADQIVAAMERASDELIARSDLMQIALAGIAKGLRPDQLINLADAARILGDAAGKDATTALRDLTEALETGRTKGLKNYLGTTIDLQAAFGDLESKLTEAEKAQALYAVTMTEAIKLQAQQTTEVDSSADKLERLEAKYKNVMTTASTWMKTAVVGITDFIRNSFLFTNPYQKAAEAAEQHAESVKKDADAVQKAIAPYQTQIEQLKELVKRRTADTAAEKEATKARAKAAEGLTKDVERLAQDRAKAELKAIEDAEAAEKRAAQERTATYVSSYKAQEAILREAEELGARYLAEQAKRDEEYARKAVETAYAEAKAREAIEEEEARTEREAWGFYYDYLRREQEARTADAERHARLRSEAEDEEKRVEREAWDAYYKYVQNESTKATARQAESLWSMRSIVQDAFSGMSTGVSTSIRGIIQGTQSMSDAVSRIFESLALGIVDSFVNRGLKTIGKALDDWLKDNETSIGSLGKSILNLFTGGSGESGGTGSGGGGILGTIASGVGSLVSSVTGGIAGIGKAVAGLFGGGAAAGTAAGVTAGAVPASAAAYDAALVSMGAGSGAGAGALGALAYAGPAAAALAILQGAYATFTAPSGRVKMEDYTNRSLAELAYAGGTQAALAEKIRQLSTVSPEAQWGSKDTFLAWQMFNERASGLDPYGLGGAPGWRLGAYSDVDALVETFRRSHNMVPDAFALGGDMFRAEGGPVWPGWSGWVGERGPERLTIGPGGYGYVTPTTGGEGGGGITVAGPLVLVESLSVREDADVERVAGAIVDAIRGGHSDVIHYIRKVANA